MLHAIGRAGEAPVPPLNLVGDFGGGGMLLAFGIVSALLEAQRIGPGPGRGRGDGRRRVDSRGDVRGNAARRDSGPRRAATTCSTPARPWYDTYETSDGKFVAIGAIEAKFYAELLERLGLAGEQLPAQHDRKGWPELRRRFAAAFRAKTRDEWCARVRRRRTRASRRCSAFSEARAHPHNVARGGHVTVGGVAQPAPAPRFSRTPGAVRRAPPERGALGREALADWGFAQAEIDRLAALGVGFDR